MDAILSRIQDRFLATTLLSLIFCAPAFAGVSSWTTSGPPGGFFRDLEINATDRNVYYAAYSRTVFRSTDAAVSWQVARHFVKDPVDIAVDPSDGNRFYVAALEDGVWRSDDGGQTFIKIAVVATGNGVWSVGVGGVDGKTVYYATATGQFFQSTDRGQTWTQRPSTTTPVITFILVDRQDGNAVHALSDTTLRRSTDGGQTWADTSFGGIEEIIRVSTNELLFASHAGIYSSADNGATFTQQTPGDFYSVSVDPTSPGTVVAAGTLDAKVYRRSGSGGSWAVIGTPLPSGSAVKIIVGGGTPSRLVTANYQSIQRSIDDGMTWAESTSGPVASGPDEKLAAAPGANARVYAYIGSNANGLLSTSLDQGWQRQNIRAAANSIGRPNFGKVVIAVKPGSPQTVFAGTYGDGVFRSNDGGNTWGPPSTGLDFLTVRAMAFDPVDPNIMYANVVTTTGPTIDPPASLYRSTDGGATWSQRSLNFRNIEGIRLVVDPANGNRLFLAGLQHGFLFPAGIGGLYRSVDGGLHWTQIFNGRDVHDVAIDPADSNRVYAATEDGLQVSVDGGTTFTPSSSFAAFTSLPASAITIDPVNPTTIYAASMDQSYLTPSHTAVSSHVLRSVNRGQTWEVLRAATDGPDWFVSDLILDPLQPSLIYANTTVRGVGAFEIQNDVSLLLSNHNGSQRPAGVAASFDLYAQNKGPLSATGVRLRVQLPAALTGVAATSTAGTCSVAVGEVTCTVPVLAISAVLDMHVTYTAPSPMMVPVSAEVTHVERDSVPADNTATANATAGELVDLGVTVTPSSTTAQAGTTVIYTVQVTNNGPVASTGGTLTFGPASGLALSSTLPAGCTASGAQADCALGAIAVSGSQSFSFTATANAAGTHVANASVTALAAAADTDAANNSASSTLTVSAAPAPTPTPSTPSSGGGGGGGAIDYLAALFLLLMTVARLNARAANRAFGAFRR